MMVVVRLIDVSIQFRRNAMPVSLPAHGRNAQKTFPREENLPVRSLARVTEKLAVTNKKFSYRSRMCSSVPSNLTEIFVFINL